LGTKVLEATSEIVLTTANVGDTRVVYGHCTRRRCGQDGTVLTTANTTITAAQRLTVDDSLENNPLEVARIERAGGFVFKGRVCGVLAVTRSLGDALLKPYVIAHPHVCELQLPPLQDKDNDNHHAWRCAIVACDGLWDVLTDGEAVQAVYDYCHEDPSKQATAADHLVSLALQKGTTDNVTVVVVWL
jgi:serine/threonine protein phosphatase PrpC